MKTLNPVLKQLLQQGTVIPAHPLALTEGHELDEKRQRLLTRHYMASGAGGIAIGVHTTQFQIRDPKINLYKKVLQLAIEEIKIANLDRPFIKVAGVSGTTEAVNEAKICAELGYDIVLVSTNGLGDWSEEALLERAIDTCTITHMTVIKSCCYRLLWTLQAIERMRHFGAQVSLIYLFALLFTMPYAATSSHQT
jgi:hypothetical protein